MATTASLSVQQLKLDLKNFRTVPQPSEASAISALVSINPDWFWALADSLLDDGYHPTENILVLKGGNNGEDLIVKEGNRRVAALKLIFGYARRSSLAVPSHIEEKIRSLPSEWKQANASVPCALYTAAEAAAVDRIVTLTHGKGEKAGRDKWGAVPRARHNRDHNNGAEPGLDLLEKYLRHGQNVTKYQKERWAGEYNLTVLDEAAKRLAPRLGVASARELAGDYPKIEYRSSVEKVLLDIGMELLGFDKVRSADFGEDYGIPATQSGAGTGGAGAASAATGQSGSPAKGAGTQAGAAASGAKRSRSLAISVDDPRAVSRVLKKFMPVGNNREKLATLLTEARKLNVGKFPHAFCFVLRSMFEISAKVYCQDFAKSGGPSATSPNGQERKLADVLRDITKHLTKNNSDKNMVKALHGAMAELGGHNGFLSVTSMNQLIHNPKFVVDGRHISTVFANVFPLLEAMNS